MMGGRIYILQKRWKAGWLQQQPKQGAVSFCLLGSLCVPLGKAAHTVTKANRSDAA